MALEYRLLVVLIAGVASLATMASEPAHAKAPKRAKIVVGKGAAGVKLGQKARIVDRRGRQVVKGKTLRGWGNVQGFCYEGGSCSWKVKGGGGVAVEISARNRVSQIHIKATRWRTWRGIHMGSKAGAVPRRYPASQLRTVCWGPYGVIGTGFLLRRRGVVTLFELNPRRTRVTAIRLLRRATSGCG